jgi:hypothetical protein
MSSLLLLALVAGPAVPLTPDALWQAWPEARFVASAAPCLRHGELVERLRALEAKHKGGAFRLGEVGRSVEGRAIHLMAVGSGPRNLLLWSQMHGDEPSATPALLDLTDFLLSGRGGEQGRAILEAFTLLMVPMLNPDGTEVYERRNAQGIDINRDALNLTTPEGRLLKDLRDRYEPELGFNLHDQNRRASVGGSSALASVSLLAVAGDAAGTVTPGRERSRRVCSAIAHALTPFIPGGVGRYDEDWSPRAFGDNLTAWGTPIVLIESGGLPPERPLEELARLNFVALLTTFTELARDDARSHDPAVYEALARNAREEWTDVVVRDARVLQPGVAEPYRADVAFDVLTGDRDRASCDTGGRRASRITELGDARFLTAGHNVDGSGAILTPAFVVAVRGGSAGDWLRDDVLARLARMGVASVVWQVSELDLAAAQARALALRRSGLPALNVVPAESPLPPVVLEGPPQAEPRTLSGILRSFEPGSAAQQRGGLVEATARLAGGARGPHSLRIAVGRPASFVTLRPQGESSGGPPDALLEAVVIDGVEVNLPR